VKGKIICFQDAVEKQQTNEKERKNLTERIPSLPPSDYGFTYADFAAYQAEEDGIHNERTREDGVELFADILSGDVSKTEEGRRVLEMIKALSVE
jgi:hypothetical protein